MSDASAFDPFAYRIRLRTLKPELEALAVEYDSQSDPLRCALNAVLNAAPSAWAEAMYDEAAEHLARFDLTDAGWGFAGLLDRHSSDTVLARSCLLRMARAATARDRCEFDRCLSYLAAEPAVAGKAVESLLPFADALITRSRTAARARTVERVSELLSAVGIEISCCCLSDLQRLGCLLTPSAVDALHHWIDFHAAPCSIVGRRIAALGDRSYSLDPTPPDTQNEVKAPAVTEREEEAVTDADAKQGPESLPKPARLAMQQYRQAVRGGEEGVNEDEMTDRKAYDYLKDEDVKLPSFDTWTRQLRIARRAIGQQKKKRRGGYTGRSAVPPEHFGSRRGG